LEQKLKESGAPFLDSLCVKTTEVPDQ